MKHARSVLASLAVSLLVGHLSAQVLIQVVPDPGGTGSLVNGDFDLNGDSHGDFIYRGRVFSGANATVLLDLNASMGTSNIYVSAVDDLEVAKDGVVDFVATIRGFIGPNLYVISGADGSVVHQAYLGGVSGGATFVTGVGDANGDGVGDLIAGSDGFGSCSNGEVCFVSGKSAFNVRFFERQSTSDGYWYGTPVGDVTGDGLANFAVRRSPCTGPPKYIVYSAVAGGGIQTVFEITDSGTLIGIGDVDRDGISDLAQVRPTFEDPQRVVVLSGADQSTIWTLAGAGYNVAGPGDVDGDSYPDILTSYPLTGAQLYSGRTGDLIWLLPGQAGSVKAVGDVNGDGLPDMGISIGGAIEVWSGKGLARLARSKPPRKPR